MLKEGLTQLTHKMNTAWPRRSLIAVLLSIGVNTAANEHLGSPPVEPTPPDIIALLERQEYRIETGETVSEVLRRWADDAGWTLIWRARRDAVIEGAAIVPGNTYPAAAKELLRVLWPTHGYRGVAYHRSRVLVIEDEGEDQP